MSTIYDILFRPPNIDPPTDLALVSVAGGKLKVSLTHPVQATERWACVQISLVSGDYTDAMLVEMPTAVTEVTVQAMPGPVTVYARAWAADAWGNVSVYTDEVTITTEAGLSTGTAWVPLVTGDETFVWLDGDLVLIEVPI